MPSCFPFVPGRRRGLAALLCVGASLALPSLTLAASFIDRAARGPALQGYDPVAYFTLGKPTPGQAAFSAEWAGARWLFATAEHRDAFLADPERYAPQYGGYCAYAVANNSLSSGDPQRWRVVDGKLYLNANFFAEQLWQWRIPQHIQSGDGHWPARRAELEARP